MEVTGKIEGNGYYTIDNDFTCYGNVNIIKENGHRLNCTTHENALQTLYFIENTIFH